MTAPLAWLLLDVAALLAIGVLAIVARAKAWATSAVYGATLFVSLTALAALAIRFFLAPGDVATVTLPLGLPWIGAHFQLDALSSFFLFVVNLGGAWASLYALGYGAHESEPHRVLPFYAAFLAGMNLVVLADDAFVFLFSWEFMSLASWALVMSHHREPENARAGYVYLLMASFGTLALLLAFGVLAGPSGSYAFSAMRSSASDPTVFGAVLALMLLGAGSKAGLVPLHVWLPLAHPAAPSHVSALMSGIMTKVAIYGFVRVVFDILGTPPWWSATAVMLLGGGTAVLGILYAMMEKDIKRLLAYSTVENVGVIFVALGLALAFRANAMAAPAALALTAALFHVLNHSLFKSLLFFGAGAVVTATGERDIEKLGGLIHRMAYTSFVFLIGVVAISALPPLNGFASEWLAFQAILLTPNLPQLGLKILAPAIGGLLALAAALAAACFVRLYGVTFLSRGRSAPAQKAEEVDRFSLAAMFGLAGLCLLAGIFPGVVIDGLRPVVLFLLGQGLPVQANIPWLSIVPIAESRSSYNGLLVFAFIALSGFLASWFIHRFASKALRRGPAWGCGFPEFPLSAQYTASSFAQPVRRVFGAIVFSARDRVDFPAPGDTRPAQFELEMRDPVWELFYASIGDAVGAVAQRLDRLQFLTIRQYLSVVFLSLVALLIVLATWR